MDAKQMQKKLNELGISFDVVRQGKRISAPKFGSSITKDQLSSLVSLGFECGLRGGVWTEPREPEESLADKYAKMTPTQRRAASKAWIDMGGWCDSLPCECGGIQKLINADGTFGPCDKCGSTKQIWES